MLKRVPIAVLVGFVVGLGAVALRFFGQPTPDDLEAFFRWQLLRTALATAEDVLVVAGVFALARRTSGRTRAYLILAGRLWIAVIVWYAASPLFDLVVGGKPWAMTFYRWSSCGAQLVIVGVACALVIAARGPRRAPIAAAMILTAVLARGVVPPVIDAIQTFFRAHPDLGVAYWTVLSLLWAAGALWLLAIIANDTAAPTAEPRRAAAGFRLAAAALRFRLVAAVVLAIMSIGLVRTPGLIDVLTIGGPAVVIATMVAYALGFLAAAHAGVEGLPPLRLAIGAAVTLWFAALQLTQLRWIYEATHQPYSYFAEHPRVLLSWSIVGPLIAAGGLALVGSAISAFAGSRGDDDLREAARARTLIAVVLFGSSAWIQAEIWKATTPDGRIMLAVIAAGAGIGAILSIIGLLRQAADSLEAGPSLPAARVVEPA